MHCYKCSNFKTSTVQSLAIHLNKVHGKNTKCDRCEYTTNVVSYMRKHEHRCYDVEEYRVKCEFCDFTAYTKEVVKNHMKSCKANSKMYQCTKCEFKASSDKNVTLHISKEHGQYTKCSFCVYESKNFQDLLCTICEMCSSV